MENNEESPRVLRIRNFPAPREKHQGKVTDCPVVEVHGLYKDYGARRAVADVSFQIARGEVLGLLGPNGSGKTTILKVLAGYLAPTFGSVAVAGFDISERGSNARRCLGYVPEGATLYPQMRVHEFLSFMGGLKGLTGATLRAGLARVIEEFHLADVAHLTLGKLSHGYRQRVAIAQAVINRPPFLIFDEPTNGLDPHQVIEVRELIKRLAPAHTILITSHILSEIERLATRVAVLLNGKLLTDRVAATSPRVVLRLMHGGTLDPARWLHEVTGVVGVEEIATDPRERCFNLDLTTPDAVSGIASAVIAAGCDLLELRPARDDLEASYLALTERVPA
ncbi:MAG: ABC transporter ATP-binding protein [Gammaproteobacteria bacterium]